MIPYSDIQSLLKQKAPFIFVDRVIEHIKGKRIVTLKNVTGSELFSALHFPGFPIYPGIFIIETIAQAASILCRLAIENAEIDEKYFFALGGIQRFNFIKPVKPGDTLWIEVDVIKLLMPMAIVKAVVKVDGISVAEGQMTFGVAKDE